MQPHTIRAIIKPAKRMTRSLEEACAERRGWRKNCTTAKLKKKVASLNMKIGRLEAKIERMEDEKRNTTIEAVEKAKAEVHEYYRNNQHGDA